MIILSIDSGIEKTGIAIFEKKQKKLNCDFEFIDSDLIKTAKELRTEQRILKICEEIEKIIDKYEPDLVVIEQLFFFKNQKTIIRVSQAQGAVLLTAAKNKIPVEFMTPLQIKQIITGYGQADKKAVQKMLSLILKLDKPFKEDDEADAVACGLAYCYQNKNLI
jgi:crossover junction endodeoxyribonuclease RuvC